jgi:hypothetical protein
MPPKSTRVRKAPNREPVSAIATRTAPTVPTPSSPNQLATQLIDPQLLLHDATITIASSLNDSSQDDENYRFVRPRSASSSLDFSTLPQQSSTQSSEFEPFERVIIPNDSQQPIQVTEKLARKFGWSLSMERALFQELLHQEDIGKRADSGFKKEAWVACCTAIKDITSQTVSIDQCKGKIDTLKGLWKEWIWLKDQSGFGYDEATGMITAGDQVWKELLKVEQYNTIDIIYKLIVIIAPTKATVASK